ncbi:carbohydrate binding domain-containing protein [Candidatus Woesearchaeota archaeon]|nr:carbohydrate binding domain-containing protein [Candidatus Woesearchaeota archaeon]MCF7900684.1 carbohydrate binding domain-containing protein [Candidatus Woesearchaeota archaeon]MCF8013206.1 carbohydrate binding domain-containing protein [Candidatus Woesearchaeota archaeon]
MIKKIVKTGAVLFLVVFLSLNVHALMYEKYLYGSECDHQTIFTENMLCGTYYDEGSILLERDTSYRTSRTILTDYFNNYLLNPSFEIDVGNAASYWNFYGSVASSISHEYSEEESRTGSYSLKISRPSFNGYGGVSSSKIFVMPNTKYVFSGYVKGSNIDKFSFDVHCSKQGSSDNDLFSYIDSSNRRVSGSFSDWTQKYLIFETDSDAEYCDVFAFFSLGGFADNVYLDDFKLEKTDEVSNLNVRNTFVVDYSYNDRGDMIRIIDPDGLSYNYLINENRLAKKVYINNLVLNGDFNYVVDGSKPFYWDSKIGSVANFIKYNGLTDNRVLKLKGLSSEIFQVIPIRNTKSYLLEFQYKGDIKLKLLWLDEFENVIFEDSVDLSDVIFDSYLDILNPPPNSKFLKLSFKHMSLSSASFIDNVKLSLENKPSNEISVEYKPNGQISSIDYGFVSTEYEYDIRDLVTRINTVNSDGATYFDESYEYDESGNTEKINNNERGVYLDLIYDDLDRLKTVNQVGEYYIGSGWSSLIFDYSYVGNIKETKFDDVAKSYSYEDDSNKLSSAKNKNFNYFPGGKVSTIEDTVDSSIVSFEYNELGRVAKIEMGDGQYSAYAYSPTAVQRKRTVNVLGDSLEIYVYKLDGTLLYKYVEELNIDDACTIKNWNPADRHFIIKGTGGAVVGIADDRGNMKLIGGITENGDASTSSGRSFKVRGSSGDVAAFDGSGNLILNGALNYYQGSVAPTDNRDFILKGPTGPVLMITADGDLFTKGCVSGGETI